MPNYKQTIICAWQEHYIAHSARSSIPDFERPLLTLQPTDLQNKQRKIMSQFSSIFSNHQNANPGTFSKPLWEKTTPPKGLYNDVFTDTSERTFAKRAQKDSKRTLRQNGRDRRKRKGRTKETKRTYNGDKGFKKESKSRLFIKIGPQGGAAAESGRPPCGAQLE